MNRLLLVSATEKANSALERFVRSAALPFEVTCVTGAMAARRAQVTQDYDLVLVNTPLGDEFGMDFALDLADRAGLGVILLVKSEILDQAMAKADPAGIFVLSKPLSTELLLQALRWMNASQNRMHAIAAENARLRMKLEDEKVVGRAKCILIECRGMTEPDAHAYIEKQAMNRRTTRREIANDILQSY